MSNDDVTVVYVPGITKYLVVVFMIYHMETHFSIYTNKISRGADAWQQYLII